jgi:hypothetical protein
MQSHIEANLQGWLPQRDWLSHIFVKQLENKSSFNFNATWFFPLVIIQFCSIYVISIAIFFPECCATSTAHVR